MLGEKERARILAANLRRDLSLLQIALLKRNEHDIGQHLGTALERAEELSRITGEALPTTR